MKRIKKSLITVSCAVAMMSAMAVTAHAQGFGIVVGTPDGANSLPSNLAGIISQISPNGNCDWNDIYEMIQNGNCGLPSQLCPGNRPAGNCPSLPGQPNRPSLPEIPEVPSLPNIPSVPTPPSQPDVPSTPETPNLPSQPGEEAPGNTLEAYATEVVRLVNEERAKAGLSPLSVNELANKAAAVRSKEQVSSFSHTRPNGTSFSTALTEVGVSYRSAGENIAYGQRSPQQVMQGWMNSSGHRANILNNGYTQIGVSCYQDASGTLYWTQLFIS